MKQREKQLVGLGGVFAVLFSVFLTRKLGIHFDELNYHEFSYTNFFGDCLNESKSCLFYGVNFVLSNSIGRLMGPYRIFSVNLCYLVLNTFGILFLVKGSGLPSQRRFLFLSLLVISPVLLFNSTHLMMENPMMGILSFYFGIAFRVQEQHRKGAGIAAPLLAGILAWMKITSLAALGTIWLCFFPPVKWKRWVPSAAAIAGVVLLGKLTSRFFPAPRHHFIEGTPESPYAAFIPDLYMKNWKQVGATAEGWVFFIWPPLLCLALYSLVKNCFTKNDREFSLRCLAAVFASYYLCVTMQAYTVYPFFRYMFPTLWVTFILVSWVVARYAPAILGWAVAISLCVPSLNLYFPSDQRLKIWPWMLAKETYYSAATVLQGSSLNAWILMTPFQRQQEMAVFSTVKESEYQGRAETFLRMVMANPRFFRDTEWEAFQASLLPKAVFRRQYEPLNGSGESCTPQCEASDYRWIDCTRIRVSEVSDRPGHPMILRTCLP